jgi:hypothetical protein
LNKFTWHGWDIGIDTKITCARRCLETKLTDAERIERLSDLSAAACVDLVPPRENEQLRRELMS